MWDVDHLKGLLLLESRQHGSQVELLEDEGTHTVVLKCSDVPPKECWSQYRKQLPLKKIDWYTQRSKKGDIAHSMGPQEGT